MPSFSFQRHGLLMVLSAPSGGGKTVLSERLLSMEPGVVRSISVTSRAPRAGEVDRVDYHFVTRERFKAMMAADAFYEWAEVHGNLYGTCVDAVSQNLAAGRDVLLVIDVQGAMTVRRRSPDAVLVFLMPPSMDVLAARLRGRATDQDQVIQKRLANALGEMEQWPNYDYIILNDSLDQAVANLQCVLRAERHRASRLQISREDC